MTSTTTAQPVPAAAANGQAKTHRNIKKVAVLGAGIMGSRIALHFANIGVQALLLDIAPKELTEDEKKAGLTLESKQVRNRIVSSLYDAALKASPSPVYEKSVAAKVQLGNFTDDLGKLADCDWIMEVVVENLAIKQSLLTEVEKVRKPGALITSNTSSIPISQISEGRSDEFKRHFCGTHFFNPPRYLKLLEIIPTPSTDPAVVDFLMHYGDLFLGKTTVLCKDTPAFIANRVGMYAFMDLFYNVEKHGLTLEEVDRLTGPVTGGAKSATFRTSDIVGLDTSVKVAGVIYDNCPNDERRDIFKLPAFVQKMVENKWFGDKTQQGFFKKTKNAEGSTEILSLDLKSFQYKSQIKVKSPALDKTKNEDSLEKRLQILYAADDKYGAFIRDHFHGLFSYVSHRIPEIANELFRLDQALCAGFGKDLGPFEIWDVLGVKEVAEAMQKAGFKVAPWVIEMVAAGHTKFYKLEMGSKLYYDAASKGYKAIPMPKEFIILNNIRENQVIWKNVGTTLFDLGDGILNLEFNTKMNTLGGEVLEGINKAIDMAESKYSGLVIGNQGENFSVGANLMMMFMMATQQDWDELEMAVRMFQNTVMRLRYSSIPTVVAAHGMTLGGGCEMSMHADRCQAAAETYIGLVEVGVGILPGGAGTKELAVRVADSYTDGDVASNVFQNYFLNAAQAKVATSAHEAFGLGLLTKKKDRISINKDRLIGDAKRAALEMAEAGYVTPTMRTDIRVLGRQALGMVYVGVSQMNFGGFASDHDKLIAEKIAYVMCGGDLSQPSLVSEQYLLDLEREAFLQLAATKKTQERIQHMLQTGKPLRN